MSQYWHNITAFNPENGQPAQSLSDWDLADIATRVTADPLLIRLKDSGSWGCMALGQMAGITTLHLFYRHLTPTIDSFANTGSGLYFGAGDRSNITRSLFYFVNAGNSSSVSANYRLYYVPEEGTSGQESLIASSRTGHQLGVGRHLKVRVDGAEIKVKVWNGDETEPGDWAHTIFDSRVAGQYYGLFLQPKNNLLMFEFLAVGTDGDEPPTGPVETKPPGLGMPISGNATSAAGQPVGAVNVFIWPRGPIVDTATPDSNGDWAAFAPTVNYGVTYIAEGCQPITHGPYLAEVE